jgi:hypothetical protein
VRGDTATITQLANGEQVSGSIARQRSNFRIHVANGTAVAIDLTGSRRGMAPGPLGDS